MKTVGKGKDNRMKLLISPAKKMRVDTDTMEPQGLPVFLAQAQELMEWMRGKSEVELKTLWACSDRLAGQNVKRLKEMSLTERLTPAILSYEGIQYQYMAPVVFEETQWKYVQEHVRILSGFYGFLKPLDGVTPYRLEMQAKGGPKGNLYDFWGSRIYEALSAETDCIVNLASKEYAACIEPYLPRVQKDGKKPLRYITCIFGEECPQNGRKGLPVVQKGTLAKMARGEMIRFAAENQLQTPEGLQRFNRLGYLFRPEYSDAARYVFTAPKANRTF